MANQFYSEFPERQAAAGGSAPDPIPRKSAPTGGGKTGTYTHPKSGTPRRRVVTMIGRRVKTTMKET